MNCAISAHNAGEPVWFLQAIGVPGIADEFIGEPVYLSEFDPDGHGGRGSFDWTADPDKAIRFPLASAARALWQTQSASVPLRPDGKPNRPLTAFTVDIVQVSELARRSL